MATDGARYRLCRHSDLYIKNSHSEVISYSSRTIILWCVVTTLISFVNLDLALDIHIALDIEHIHVHIISTVHTVVAQTTIQKISDMRQESRTSFRLALESSIITQ